MGSFGGLLGTAGGAGGTGFKGPQAASINSGLPGGSIGTTYNNAQYANTQQQQLNRQLAGTSPVQQQNTALQQQEALSGQIAGLKGAQNLQGTYGQTQNLAAQLAAANGVGNQANAMAQQQGFNQSVAGGVGAQNAAIYQQADLNQALSGGVGAQNAAMMGLAGIQAQQARTGRQYQDIANGRGPNPAQAMLAQQTGQNVANQASLMAGQRGAAQNVGLLARQAAQQGAATQQQAAGQAATMQAQQSLNALQGLSAQQQAQAATAAQLGSLGSSQAQLQQAGIGQLGGLGSTQAQLQQAGIGQQAALANQQIAQQQAQQQAMAQQAAQQIAFQQAQQQAVSGQTNVLANQYLGATNQLAQQQMGEQQLIANQLQGYNQAQVAMQGNVNTGNAGLAQTQLQGQHGLVGGLLNGVGAALGAEGGEVKKLKTKKYAMGSGPDTQPLSTVPPVQAPMAPQIATPAVNAAQPQSSWTAFLKGAMSGSQNQKQDDDLFNMASDNGSKELQKGSSNFASGLFNSLSQPSQVASTTPGSYAGIDASKAAAASSAMGANGGLASTGGHVAAKNPNQKAEKTGNSYDNDKIPAMLSEGEIVLPRTVTQSADPIRSAADFVAKVMAKKGRKHA